MEFIEAPVFSKLLASYLLTLATLAAAPLSAQVNVTTRQAADTLIIRIGPIALPANGTHHQVRQPALQTWRMPQGAWLRGYRVAIVDDAGATLPIEILHHAEMVDLERRDLLRPALYRVVSAGKETPSLMLPAGMGYPVRAGQELGINAMLHNPTPRAYRAAFVEARIPFTPDTVTTAPRSIFAFYLETQNPDGSDDSSFDLPPGRTEKTVEAQVPVAGAILAVGGHVHDYGTRLSLARAGGDTLYAVSPDTNAQGKAVRTPTLPMFGRNNRVAAGERFVMKVEYRNPTSRTLAGEGMGTMGVVFAPDDPAAWPALDRSDPRIVADLARLRGAAGGHSHH